MAKVSIKSEKLTPLGVVYFTSKAFNALSLGKVFNESKKKIKMPSNNQSLENYV